jgi:iron complex outermembrane receptor protein
MALENTGTTTLDESNVLVDPNDKLDNQTLILYLDFDYDFDNGWKITNQLSTTRRWTTSTRTPTASPSSVT